MLIAVSLNWFAEYAHVLQMLWHKGITVDWMFYIMLILMAWFSVFLAQLKNWSCRLRVNVHSSICSENEKWPGKFPQHLPTYANKKELNVFPFPMWNIILAHLFLCASSLHLVVDYIVWDKKSPPAFFWQFFQTVGNFRSIFTHLLYVPFYARLQIFIQLSPTLTKSCYSKRDHPSIFFYISLELLSLLTEQIISNMFVDIIKAAYLPKTSCQWLANVWTRAFRPIVDIFSILCELNSHA